jgi:lysophospholipase L1-like esterase
VANTAIKNWVGTWTSTPAPVEGRTLGGQTARMIARVSIGGQTVRIRLSNACGLRKLTIGAVHIARHLDGTAIDPGSNRAVTFNGATSATIGAGALVVSDPIEFDLKALSDLAVSVYLPDRLEDTFQITGHGNARQTSYLSPHGDFSSATDLTDAEPIEDLLILSGIDVLAPTGTGGIVTLGDSLTDCNISTIDAHRRWPDELARRLQARHEQDGGRLLGVMNQGIGGNRILHDKRGDSCLRRFDRDVLAQPGVTHAIVFLGINDIRNRYADPKEIVTADEMIAGLNQLAMRAHAAGIKIYGGTMLTFENENYNPPPGLPGLYTEAGEAVRQAVNGWIREAGAFDAVIDFELALRDPDHPTQMLPVYDCGDHLHPGDEGYLRMGQFVDLSLFD